MYQALERAEDSKVEALWCRMGRWRDTHSNRTLSTVVSPGAQVQHHRPLVAVEDGTIDASKA
jgi:hypothetical protein